LAVIFDDTCQLLQSTPHGARHQKGVVPLYKAFNNTHPSNGTYSPKYPTLPSTVPAQSLQPVKIKVAIAGECRRIGIVLEVGLRLRGTVEELLLVSVLVQNEICCPVQVIKCASKRSL